MTNFYNFIRQVKFEAVSVRLLLHRQAGTALDGFNVVAAYNLCDAATFLKTILGSYW